VLALAGTAAVVHLDPRAGSALDETCAVLGIPVLDAAALVGDLDEAEPDHLAALVRSALDSRAGA